MDLNDQSVTEQGQGHWNTACIHALRSTEAPGWRKVISCINGGGFTARGRGGGGGKCASPFPFAPAGCEGYGSGGRCSESVVRVGPALLGFLWFENENNL